MWLPLDSHLSPFFAGGDPEKVCVGPQEERPLDRRQPDEGAAFDLVLREFLKGLAWLDDGCQPFFNPTNTREPAMSLCLNDRRNRVHLPSNLDLSSEINLMVQRQAEREGFSTGFPHEGVILMPE